MLTKWLCLFLLSGTLLAEQGTSTQTATPASYSPPLFKFNLDSATYDFQGYIPANNDIYSFENVTYDTQAFSLSYLYSPTLSFTVSALHAKKYAETNFLGILYKDETQGFGDTTVKATKTFFNSLGLIVTELGVSVPTGSITEKNANDPTGTINYPYNMQLGSGTYDVLATAMLIKSLGSHQLGLMGHANIKTGRSDLGYRRGNDYNIKTWYSYVFNQYFTQGIWFNYFEQHGVVGEDPTYGRNIFVNYYHTYRNFMDVTMNMNANYPITKKLSAKVLAGIPLWQDTNNIDNIQVNTRWFASVGLEAAF